MTITVFDARERARVTLPTLHNAFSLLQRLYLCYLFWPSLHLSLPGRGTTRQFGSRNAYNWRSETQMLKPLISTHSTIMSHPSRRTSIYPPLRRIHETSPLVSSRRTLGSHTLTLQKWLKSVYGDPQTYDNQVYYGPIMVGAPLVTFNGRFLALPVSSVDSDITYYSRI